MSKVVIPSSAQSERRQISPDYTRISLAAAIELGLKPGRFYRDVRCGCINLLQNYPEGCYANCTYCGLARERPGVPEENSFIRVAWPLYPTSLVAEAIAEREHETGVGRVCISQVQDHRSNDDLLTMTRIVHEAAHSVPISALVNATTITEQLLAYLRDLGVDKIGFGLDAATEDIFYSTRGRGTMGPHTWKRHWEMIQAARNIYGPMNVNCHVIVGLGETDRDLIDLFVCLSREKIEAYIFSFNPELGTQMQSMPRASITRHRRVQLAKHLIETAQLSRANICFDDNGMIAALDMPEDVIEEAILSPVTFMTDGCPDREGVMSCNRPYGSYRPGEEFRDYPFVPELQDIAVIRTQLNVEALHPSICEVR